MAKGEVGIHEKTPARKLKDYAATWLDKYVKVHCKHATHRLYKQTVDQHLKAIESKRLDEITRDDIKNLIAKKIGEGLSKATVRNIIAPLRQMLNQAVDEGIILANPANRLGGFRKETSSKANAMKVVPYTTKEVQKLLVKARDGDFQLYAFVLTAVLTGMRLGELIGLHWDDIDSQNGCIHVKCAVSRRRLETPKSHLQRRIDLPDELSLVFEELKRRKREECFGKGERLPNWVFSNQAGQFLDEQNLRQRQFFPLLKAAEVRRVRFHDLRHTYASLMLQQGESITYVKEQMRHHSIQITVDLYGHLIPGANRAAANRLESSLLEKTKTATAGTVG